MSDTPRCSRPVVNRIRAGLALAAFLVAGAPASAKNHLWKFTEVYSNADGTIQFIEMQECCGSDLEIQMASADLVSNGHVYHFPNNLVGPTAHTWLLIATAGFAALPGAPTPDFIIPDGFFDPAGDTLRYRLGTDIVTLDPDELPTDGVHSLERVGFSGSTFVVGVNSPINFAGDSGSVSIPAVPTGMPLVVLVGLGLSLTASALFALRRTG
ncbi:MAG: hypothetical protein IPK00_26695 [Deltaproteobacteria bacterium]|nr:hypothetical protein [Deltaproteobacteria bacterium]